MASMCKRAQVFSFYLTNAPAVFSAARYGHVFGSDPLQMKSAWLSNVPISVWLVISVKTYIPAFTGIRYLNRSRFQSFTTPFWRNLQ